ncbi:MAG: hypothetical protein EOM37_08825 [Proteobacteria bacterium]|jgi:hypothetical protein|nr:hypothetical protein [Alphaproteobacteria bacterium]NCC04128.1 hypothetical protein [Pseudomonadota bacterium]
MKEKLKTAAQFVIYGLFVVFVMAGSKVFMGTQTKPTISIVKHEDIENDIDKKLQDVANELNKGLPKQIDEDTRLDMVFSTHLSLVYNYTLSHHISSSFNEDSFIRLMKPNLISSVCHNPRIRMTKKFGISSIFVYKGEDGTVLAKIPVYPSVCKTTP